MGNSLYQSYPRNEYISGEILYRLLHISKRKMKYLLENGYIPYIDTGKKTHRYVIRIEDAERFKNLYTTESELQDCIKGNFSSGTPYKGKPKLIDGTPENSSRFKAFLSRKWKDEPDAVTAKRVAELVGIGPQRIRTLCQEKKIFSVKLNDRIYCSKETVIEYFSSVERLRKPYLTKGYSDLVKQFTEEEYR